MPVTPTQFVANYPEFADAQAAYPGLVLNALSEAYALTPAAVWPPTLLDAGAQLRAAQTLALSPFGRNLAMVGKDGSTAYDQRLSEFVARVAAGGSVV